MLKRRQTLTRRRMALASLSLIGMTGLAWAAQVAPAALPSTQRVFIQADVRIGDNSSRPRLITMLGVPATIGIDHGDGSGHWEIVMTVTQEPDGQLRVHTERKFGSPLQKLDGDHTQIAPAGQPFEMRFPAPGGGPTFVMKRVVSLVAADFKPPK